MLYGSTSLFVGTTSLVRWDHSPHVESICPDFQLASVRVTLQSDSVSERSDCTVLVFPAGQLRVLLPLAKSRSNKLPSGDDNDRDLPNSTGDTWDTLLLRDLGLINGYFGEFSRSFVELDRFGAKISTGRCGTR